MASAACLSGQFLILWLALVGLTSLAAITLPAAQALNLHNIADEWEHRDRRHNCAQGTMHAACVLTIETVIRQTP